MSELVFYDIPSKDGQGAWSPNTLKTRLALNFKGVDYETQWIEYPDIAATISNHVEPNVIKQKHEAHYSLPAVKFPDGTYVMDSRKIAEGLEKDHPSPSFKLDDPAFVEVVQYLPKISEALRGIWMPRVPAKLLSDRSAEYFTRTRAERFGKSLVEISRELGGEEAWIEALPPTIELGHVLGRHGGPFVLGGEATYADLTIIAFLHFLILVDERIYEKLVKIEPRLGTLYEAGKKYTERSHH